MNKAKSIEESLLSKFGKGTLTSATSIIDSKNIIIPVSPAIDLILSGGIPEGSFVVTTGPPKLGKTSFCLHFAGHAQKPRYNSELSPKGQGRHIYFFNIEGRIKSRDLTGIKHLDISKEKFTIIESSPGNILTAENYIDIAEQLINEKPGCIFILDSFSALCTEEDYAGDIGKRFRANSPLLLARFCRRISNIIPINKSIVMGITHMIANQGMGMSPWMEASGRKLQYQTDVKLKGTHFTPWKSGETQIGQDIHWECTTSAIGPPGGKCTSKFRYGYGIDKEAELVDLCVDLSLIKKGGAWYTLGEEKFHGLENARSFLVKNPEKFEKLNREVREMMGLSETKI